MVILSLNGSKDSNVDCFFLFVNSLQTLSCGSCVGGKRFVVFEPVAGFEITQNIA